MKDRKKKIKFIQGFVDFCNSSLDNLTMTEKVWWHENIMAIWGYEFSYVFPHKLSETGEVKEEAWEIIKRIQNEIYESLDWVFKYIKKRGFRLNINVHQHFESDSEFYFDDGVVWGGPVIIEVYKAVGHSFKDAPLMETKRVHISLVFFLKALSGFPTSSLMRCPICKKIFFNPTQRAKIYCTPRCQNTAAVRRLREQK